MSDNASTTLWGITAAEWEAAYAANISEFPASRFVILPDGDLVRFAFGHEGAPLDEAGNRAAPVYSVAISVSPLLAAQIRDALNKIIQTSDVARGKDDS